MHAFGPTALARPTHLAGFNLQTYPKQVLQILFKSAYMYDVPSSRGMK